MAAALALSGVAQAQTQVQTPAQTKPAEKPKDEAPREGWRDRVLEIGSQPGRDVGVMKRDIPAILDEALADPYSLQGLKTCVQLAGEISKLNEVLGPDYIVGAEVKESRAGKLAEAGGRTVINSIIPFRRVIREISGAAAQERRYNAAVYAGVVRRSFLKGIGQQRGCKYPSAPAPASLK